MLIFIKSPEKGVGVYLKISYHYPTLSDKFIYNLPGYCGMRLAITFGLYLVLVYNAYLLLMKHFGATLFLSSLLLMGTILAIASVKRLGHYYVPAKVEKPKKVLFSWDEPFGLQVKRWKENMRTNEILLLGIMALVVMWWMGLMGTFTVLFFTYAYFVTTTVGDAFSWKNSTYVSKDGIYRSTPKGLRKLTSWGNIAVIHLSPAWLVYVRTRSYRYYYFMPDDLDKLYRILTHEKEDKHHHRR
jgi:hypothetical protein